MLLYVEKINLLVSNVVKLRDHKYHKGLSDELLDVCIEGK